VEIEVVGHSPILGVGYYIPEGQLAKPAVLPEHIPQKVFIGLGSSGGYHCRDDLPIPTSYCHVGFVGQMQVDPPAGNHRGLWVGPAYQLVVGLAAVSVGPRLPIARWHLGLRSHLRRGW
jgi:hypothetical protein